jgi:hypothetical protein
VEERKVVVDGPMGEMEGVADGRSESGIQRQFESPGSSATGAIEWIWPLSWPCLDWTGFDWGWNGNALLFPKTVRVMVCGLSLCSLLQSTETARCWRRGSEEREAAGMTVCWASGE